MAEQFLTPEEEARRKLLEQQAADTSPTPSAEMAGPAAVSIPSVGGVTPAGVSAFQPALVQPNVAMPSAVPPPPPQPPPPPPELAGLAPQVGGFAADWMAQPNRYLSDLATATRGESEARLAKAQQDAQRGIEEWAAQRGLVGSSYEGEQRVNLAGELDRSRRADERALLEMLTTAESLDRQSAGQYGLEAMKTGDVMGLERYKAALEAAQLAESQRQFGGTLEISQQQIDLRAQELQQEAALQGRSLDLQSARDQAQKELSQQQLSQQESQFGRTLGLSQQDIDLRAQQLQQQAVLEGRSLDLQQARDQATQELTREQMAQQGAQFTQDVELRAQQLQQQAALEGRCLDIQSARDQATQLLAREQMALQESQFGRTLQISQQDVDLRAQQLQQEATLQGRSLDLQAARDQAQLEISREQMAQAERLQMAGLTQRESEFARSFGLDEQQFMAQQDQFTKTYSEQVASRLQQNAQFATALQSDEARYSLDVGLRSRALDLQQQGMTADEAFRTASLAQERELTLGAQTLQQQGMQLEDAYRYAALEQDGTFKQRTLDLQQQGMLLEDAYRQAELELQQQQLSQRESEFARELEFKVGQAATEQERFNLMMELWNKYFGTEGGTPTVTTGTGGGDGGITGTKDPVLWGTGGGTTGGGTTGTGEPVLPPDFIERLRRLLEGGTTVTPTVSTVNPTQPATPTVYPTGQPTTVPWPPPTPSPVNEGTTSVPLPPPIQSPVPTPTGPPPVEEVVPTTTVAPPWPATTPPAASTTTPPINTQLTAEELQRLMELLNGITQQPTV